MADLTPGGGDAVRATTNTSYGGSTLGSSETTGSCSGSGPEDLLYFTVCPATTRTVSADTCGGAGWDTVLYMRSGGDNLELECNNDSCAEQSSVSRSVTGPGLFGVFVDGSGGASGSYTVGFTGL